MNSIRSTLSQIEKNKLDSELSDAYFNNDFNKIIKLIIEGADPNLLTDDNSNIIHYVAPAYDGDVETTKLLLELGAEPDIQNKNGQTPLMRVALADVKNPKIYQLLLNAGANVNAIDNYGQTPLLLATETSPEIIQLLLNHGANINAIDQLGRTPLIYAIINRNFDIVDLLLKNGSDPTIQVPMRDTALEAALKIKKYYDSPKIDEVINTLNTIIDKRLQLKKQLKNLKDVSSQLSILRTTNRYNNEALTPYFNDLKDVYTKINSMSTIPLDELDILIQKINDTIDESNQIIRMFVQY